jgi:hypothetical protein
MINVMGLTFIYRFIILLQSGSYEPIIDYMVNNKEQTNMSNVAYLKIVSPCVAELRSTLDNWLLQKYVADTPLELETYLNKHFPKTTRC